MAIALFWVSVAQARRALDSRTRRFAFFGIHIRQPISAGKLLLDVSNYRITKQTSQKAARDAMTQHQFTTQTTFVSGAYD